MKEDKLKNKIINIIIGIFTFNFIIIFIYCTFFLNNRIQGIVKKDKDYLDKSFSEIKKDLSNIDENTIISIENKYNIQITLKDNDSNIIYNSLDEEGFDYSVSDLITINDDTYLLKCTIKHSFSITMLIGRILIVQLIFALIIIIISYQVSSRQILKPIANLRHDMINYRNGKLPIKRESNTSIDELQNNFVRLTESLELEKSRKNEIIASISHDIKTPLTSIMGYASRLENANLSEEVKTKYISRIRNKAFAIKVIIDEFDDYLGTSIKGNINFDEVSIKELIGILKTEYEEEVNDKNIKFKIKCNCKKDSIVLDKAKIKRVFSNLISNSIRHIKDNGEIIININGKGQYVEFEVSDNGTGVEKEYLKKIFDPLYTTDSSRKISGLGLSICRQIIKAHEGVIYAKNNERGGLSIFFTIKKVKN